MQTTWMPSTESGVIHNRAELPESVFAFPKQRKEPLTDADHVRNALARFDQVEGVSDSDRDLAFAKSRRRRPITASTCARIAGAISCVSFVALPDGFKRPGASFSGRFALLRLGMCRRRSRCPGDKR